MNRILQCLRDSEVTANGDEVSCKSQLEMSCNGKHAITCHRDIEGEFNGVALP